MALEKLLKKKKKKGGDPVKERTKITKQDLWRIVDRIKNKPVEKRTPIEKLKQHLQSTKKSITEEKRRISGGGGDMDALKILLRTEKVILKKLNALK